MAPKILLKMDGLARTIPTPRWLAHYETGWFRADVLAGLTLWGILVPEGIAYAALAGAPVQAGLYTLLASLVVYAILGTTRQAVSAPTSGSSIMMATVVAPFLVSSAGELAELLVLLVLVVGIIFLLSGLARLGFVVAFISHSVMTGFVFGLSIYIAVSQTSKLFGLPRGHGDILYQLCHLIGQLGAANWVTFAIGAGALALLYVFEARAPRAPAPLMIMAAGILVVSVLRLADEHGVQVVGVIHPGFPAVSLPKVNLDDVLDLLPGACAIALFILSEALGVGYSLSSKYGYDIDSESRIGCHRRLQPRCSLPGWNREWLQCVIDSGQRPRGSQESGLVTGGGGHGVDHFNRPDAAFPQSAASGSVSNCHPRSGADDEDRGTQAFLSISSGRVRASPGCSAWRDYGRDTAGPGYRHCALAVSVYLGRQLPFPLPPRPSTGQGALLRNNRAVFRLEVHSRPRNFASRLPVIFCQCPSLPQ